MWNSIVVNRCLLQLKKVMGHFFYQKISCGESSAKGINLSCPKTIREHSFSIIELWYVYVLNGYIFAINTWCLLMLIFIDKIFELDPQNNIYELQRPVEVLLKSHLKSGYNISNSWCGRRDSSVALSVKLVMSLV